MSDTGDPKLDKQRELEAEREYNAPQSSEPARWNGFDMSSKSELNGLGGILEVAHEVGKNGHPLNTELLSRQLLDLALSCLPEKHRPDIYSDIPSQEQAKGWNQAIDTIEAQIKLKFGGSDASN